MVPIAERKKKKDMESDENRDKFGSVNQPTDLQVKSTFDFQFQKNFSLVQVDLQVKIRFAVVPELGVVDPRQNRKVETTLFQSFD